MFASSTDPLLGDLTLASSNFLSYGVNAHENQECCKRLPYRLRRRFSWWPRCLYSFIKDLPADMGVAIVIVNHLRTVATLLHEILPHHTKMPVKLITERLDIEPNHVFIIPEKRDLHVLDGEFRLKPISKPRGWPDVITVFMRSLTENWDGKLIAVIVSGLMVMVPQHCTA
jgi:hypothetical protein